MIMRICGKVGCNELVKKEDKYCEAHMKQKKVFIKESHKWYKKNRDDDWEQKFYNSKHWERARDNALDRDKYLCKMCYREKKITKADMVHHIIELKENRELGLDEENLISLCDACHKKVHAKYRGQGKSLMQQILRSLFNKIKENIYG
jgi:5-methylcytosine-specific restriction endonuclease McrA